MNIKDKYLSSLFSVKFSFSNLFPHQKFSVIIHNFILHFAMYSQDWKYFSINVGLRLINVSFFIHFTALQMWKAAIPTFSIIQEITQE
jgi:hypothetical protein